jgi:nicotinamidase-related amidase
MDGAFNPRTTALVIIDMQKDCEFDIIFDDFELEIYLVTFQHLHSLCFTLTHPLPPVTTPKLTHPVCSPGGYLSTQGYSLTPILTIIPRLTHLLTTFRAHSFPIYHTREGHRPDLSTLSLREASRSKLTSGLGIGDAGPLGRLLIRGEAGHDIIPELYPLPSEPIVDKPGRSAFAHTDFELMLRIKGIKNLVVCGVTTDVCVGSTVREANDRGFDCVVVEDGCAASEGFL